MFYIHTHVYGLGGVFLFLFTDMPFVAQMPNIIHCIYTYNISIVRAVCDLHNEIASE